MNLKRAFLILIAATFLPGMAFAQLRIDTSVEYLDENPVAVVVVNKQCDDGLPLDDSETLGHKDSVVFVTTDLGAAFTCTVTAVWDGNYSAMYVTDSGTPSTTPCTFTEQSGSDGDNTCEIGLTPDQATVIVGKSWESSGAVGDEINYEAVIIARAAEGVIDGATPCLVNGGEPGLDVDPEFCLKLKFSGKNPADQSFKVFTGYDGAIIGLKEDAGDSSVETTDDCNGAVSVTPGSTATCAFTNTVFFEGIPTLSQYGLAIMALLMLGVGFVGFRRFV